MNVGDLLDGVDIQAMLIDAVQAMTQLLGVIFVVHLAFTLLMRARREAANAIKGRDGGVSDIGDMPVWQTLGFGSEQEFEDMRMEDYRRENERS